MIKTFICFLISCIVYLHSNAQNAVADSLRSLVQKIKDIPAAQKSSCKKLSEFETDISKIDPSNLQIALSKFILADTLFIKANKCKDCPLCNTVSNLNSMLTALKSETPADSVEILKAILYVKYHIKESEFVRLTLAVVNDKSVKIENAGITLQSFEPSIVPPGASDSTYSEIYILRGVSYLLTIADSGYISYRGMFSAQKDTGFTITLHAIGATKVPPVTTPPNQNEQATKSYWWIPAVLLVLVLFAIIWKIISGKKNRLPETFDRPETNGMDKHIHELNESIGLLHEKMKEKDNLISKDAREIETLQLKLGAMSKAGATKDISHTKNTGKYFLSEIMMTAGPRKPTDQSNSDGDLGEDVCGFIMSGDEVFVWVLDGSSSYSCLREPATNIEYFSSRLLAQSIGRKLKSHFAERRMEAFDKTMVTIVNEVKSDWLKTINSLPESEKIVLRDNIKQGFRPECASALLIGSLSLSGELNVYRVGDSKMFIYSTSGDQKVFVNTSLAIGKDKNYDYLFFILGLTEKEEFEIKGPEPKFEMVRQENIQTVISFSDGIGKVTEEALKKVYPVNADAARNDLIYQLQGTGDDKSLCIIEIKE